MRAILSFMLGFAMGAASMMSPALGLALTVICVLVLLITTRRRMI